MIEWKFNKNTCSYWTYVEQEDIWTTGTPTRGDIIFVSDDFYYVYAG